jgi:methylmalonic aciduria homocystinuria type C protein
MVEEAIDNLKSTLETYGIDIVQPLALSWYNGCLPEHALASQILPATLKQNSDDALTLLVGNSKALWPKFLAFCASDPWILDIPHPLNRYIERSVITALDQVFIPAVLPPSSTSSSTSSLSEYYSIYWSHETAKNLRGGEGYVAMQRMAECSGLAFLDHTSHLSFHPKLGPWFSLRCAVVIYGVSTDLLTKPTPLSCMLDDETMANVKAAAKIAFTSTEEINKGGVGTGEDETLPEIKDVRKGWKKWLAVRDASAPEHPYRYSDEQILYHYTGNRQLLRELVVEPRNKSSE